MSKTTDITKSRRVMMMAKTTKAAAATEASKCSDCSRSISKNRINRSENQHLTLPACLTAYLKRNRNNNLLALPTDRHIAAHLVGYCNVTLQKADWGAR